MKKLVILLGAFLIVGAFAVAQVPGVFHHPAEIQPQGSGSTLDSDMVDGLHAADLLAQASDAASERRVTLWGTTTCPAGYNTIQEGRLTRFYTHQAAPTGGGANVPVLPALNVFACAGTQTTVVSADPPGGDVYGWDPVPQTGTVNVLECVICERS